MLHLVLGVLLMAMTDVIAVGQSGATRAMPRDMSLPHARQTAHKDKELAAPFNSLNWFNSTICSGLSLPPMFNSFREWIAALSPSWAKPKLVPELIVPWQARSVPPQVGQERLDLNIPANIGPLAWSLATPSPSPATCVSAAITAPPKRENPNSKL